MTRTWKEVCDKSDPGEALREAVKEATKEWTAEDWIRAPPMFPVFRDTPEIEKDKE